MVLRDLASIALATLLAAPTATVAQESGWRVPFDGRGLVPFVVAEGMLFASGNDGALLAFDMATGERRWQFQIGERAAASKVIVTNETRLAGMIAAAGLGINRKVALGRPVLADGSVYIASFHSEPPDLPNVYALDATSGRERWSYFAPGGAAVSMVSCS